MLRGPKRRACSCLLHGPRERADDPSLRPRLLPSASRPLYPAQGISPLGPAVQAEREPLPGRLPPLHPPHHTSVAQHAAPGLGLASRLEHSTHMPQDPEPEPFRVFLTRPIGQLLAAPAAIGTALRGQI